MTDFKKYLTIAHAIFAGLMILDIILFFTSDRTFRGIYSDRIVFGGLFITGGLLFSLFNSNKTLPEIYFSVYILYPTIAALTFFGDRLAFVIIASPILLSLLLPQTYYKDNQYELRSVGGFLAHAKVILIEKEWFTEKELGQKVYDDSKYLDVQKFEIISQNKEYLDVRFNYRSSNEIVRFETSH